MKRIFVLLIIIMAVKAATAQTHNLGIVTDFERSSQFDSIVQIIEEEINRTTGPAKSFALDATDGIAYGISTKDEAQSAYAKLSQSSDIVILLGSTSVVGNSELESFPVPTIGLGIVDPQLQDLPYENGISGISNFTYIWAAKDLQRELSVFQQIVPFENLTILVNESSAPSFNQEKGLSYLDSLKRQLSSEIQILQVGTDVEASLSGLDADAVYVSYLYGKSAAEITNIADGLKNNNIPSFSSQKFHVDNGIMACISDANDFEQVVRKLAIMVDEAAADAPLAEMPVNINFKEDLFINSRTVKAIEVPLSFEILFTANFIDDEEDLPTYSLEEVMERALRNNFGIKISNQDISLAIQDAKFAKTAILPFLDLGISGQQVNEESTFVILDRPERRLAGQLTLDQVIYSEEAMAGIKIAYYLQKAQESATEAEILQIYLNIYLDYFAVLAAKTALQIETENLDNLKTNLELARIRVNSGAASRAEILRWESEVATANQKVVEANTNLYNTKFRLNTSVANTLEEEFDIADITVDDAIYQQFSESLIAQFIDNPEDIEAVSRFLVNESVSKNPNKQALIQQIKAVERRNKQNRRLLYTPNVAFQAQMAQTFARGGANSNAEEFGIPNNTWNVGVGVSFPIFAGNKRKVNLQTTKIQLDQLNNSRMQLDQELELAVKSSLTTTVATSTNIGFSRVSSDNAKVNFELVRDQYQAGEVNITQLIDAQQSSLSAQLRYAVAIYEYLQSQLQLEFSVGFFSMFATPEQLQEFEDRFTQFRTNL